MPKESRYIERFCIAAMGEQISFALQEIVNAIEKFVAEARFLAFVPSACTI